MSTVNIEKKGDYAIVQMEHGKVNAIDSILSNDLGDAFVALDQDETVKGVILTGRPHCFSAGLNVQSLIEEGEAFWRAYLPMLQKLARFSKPFVCAITGYAPAGATTVTLCADYRVMGKGPKHVVGMHEFKMSMLIPKMMSDIYAYHLGEIKAWKFVQQAKLFNSDEALAVGLVDESVEVEEVMERAEKELKRRIQVYGPTYSKSKKYLRKGLLEAVDGDIEAMVATIAEDWNDPFVQQSIKMFLASLKS